MAMGSLLIVLNFIYNCTIGPSTYTIIGEISSTRLRQKTIVLARASYKAINIVAGILNPRMLCKIIPISEFLPLLTLERHWRGTLDRRAV
jgi:hypothetical protein